MKYYELTWSKIVLNHDRKGRRKRKSKTLDGKLIKNKIKSIQKAKCLLQIYVCRIIIIIFLNNKKQ